MSDFRELLSMNMDDIHAPVALPPGTYYATIKDYSFDKSPNKGTNYVRFNLVNIRPGEDVNRDALNGINLAERILSRDFYVTPDAVYRIKDMIASLGIKTEGRSLQSTIPETPGSKVVISVTNTTSRKDGKTIYTNVEEMRGID